MADRGCVEISHVHISRLSALKLKNISPPRPHQKHWTGRWGNFCSIRASTDVKCKGFRRPIKVIVLQKTVLIIEQVKITHHSLIAQLIFLLNDKRFSKSFMFLQMKERNTSSKLVRTASVWRDKLQNWRKIEHRNDGSEYLLTFRTLVLRRSKSK